MVHYENASEAEKVWRQPAEMWRWMAKIGAGIGAASGLTSPLTTKGDVWGFDSSDNRIPIGSDTQVLTADSSQPLGLKWAAAPGTTSPLTTKGDLWGFSSVNARIPIGSNNQVLTADSTQALGLKWATPSFTNYWAFSANQLNPDTTNTAGMTELLATLPTNTTYLELLDDGGSGSSHRLAKLAGLETVSITAGTVMTQNAATSWTATTTQSADTASVKITSESSPQHSNGVIIKANEGSGNNPLTANFFSNGAGLGTECGLTMYTTLTGTAQVSSEGPLIEMENSNPINAPASGYGRIFMRLTGGKMQFCALFPTGAVQPIATEP